VSRDIKSYGSQVIARLMSYGAERPAGGDMAKKVMKRLPMWLGILKELLDYATRHEHEFDVTISTTLIGREVSLNLKGKVAKKPL